MREHPIPQDITGYKFHLIGNMTLKQFAEILLGAVIAFVLIKSGLPGIIRWPAALLFAGTGAMAAFVPIEERPLDHWIITFVKVLFKPTKFFWKRKPKIPDLFSYESSSTDEDIIPGVNLSPARKERVSEFMRSINYSSDQLDKYDQAESLVVNQLIADFDQVQVKKVELTPQLEQKKPSLKVRVRKMNDLSSQQTVKSKAVDVYNADKTTIKGKQVSFVSPTSNGTVDFPESMANTLIERVSSNSGKIPGENSPPTLELPATDKQRFLEPEKVSPFNPLLLGQQGQVVGTVFSIKNELIPSVLINILDTSGEIVMATQTNSLGQFIINQLAPGEYIVQPFIPNSNFSPISLTISDNQSLVQLEIRENNNDFSSTTS